MNKFKQINYIRPNIKEIKANCRCLTSDLKMAKSYMDFKRTFKNIEEMILDVSTFYVVANIRNNINTSDLFYDEEIKFFNKEIPKLIMKLKKINKILLTSSFRKEFEDEYGTQITKSTEAFMKTIKFRVLTNKIKENNLTTEYSKLVASCKTVFNGEECNFYGLQKYMESTDRTKRKEAYEAWAELYKNVSPKLYNIYDKLVDTRCKKAKRLGYKSYIELAYLERKRFDYNSEDIKKFRGYIKKHIVPVCQQLVENQRKELGVDKIMYYDEKLIYKDGNAVPHGNKDELVKSAQKMYRELSKETGEFFDFMVNYELFDLETKPNKHLGGYCTALPKYKAPFIFSNFNGTSADIDVLTHEAGHAFQAYTSMRSQELLINCSSTCEINEIHSMAMEFFTYPWMKEFFGEDTDKYTYAHLCMSIMTIPYMACVDEFQHEVYNNHKITGIKRNELWRKIEKQYMPWRDYDGNEFLESGGFWMQKQHIFMYPFYYIDYALAQICVYELYGKMKKDMNVAWNDYYELCKLGGSKGYFELLSSANLSNPFEEETIKNAVEIVKEELGLTKKSNA